MMPNIVRGERASGLMTYLVGPGRANEHTEPHLVAGDDALMVWYDDGELSHESALEIGRYLDKPRKAFGTEVPGGHVWHCSLSLRAEEGQLTDTKWAAIAKDFVAAMDFDDNEGTKAPCRWVAVRHGVSKAGNDHIHLAVDLVREDGTKASIHNDFKRAQNAARALEVKYGLEELESAQVGRATRGYHPAEKDSEARRKAVAKYQKARSAEDEAIPTWSELPAAERKALIAAEKAPIEPRAQLALRVRGCAAASENEAEFVRRMRRSGLLVRPRFAQGRDDVVTGYSVAKRPEFGERPIWYGGGHLARDLALPRLREAWLDTPQGASEAAAEWNAAKRGRRVVAPGREAVEPDPQMWGQVDREVTNVLDHLKTVDVDDHETWATIARQTAGALAAWSNATEDTPGDLGQAAEALSRSAQTYKSTPNPKQVGSQSLAGVAMLLASAAYGGKGAVGQAALIRQLLRLTQAVHAAAQASAQARQAQLLAEDTRARLVRVRESLPTPATSAGAPVTAGTAKGSVAVLEPETQAVLERMQASQAHQAGRLVNPLPTDIQPAARKQKTRPTRNQGVER